MLEFLDASSLNEVISKKKRMISYVHQTLVVVACYQKIEIIINMGISLQSETPRCEKVRQEFFLVQAYRLNSSPLKILLD